MVEIPDSCKGCTLTGFAAINCPIFYDLSDEVSTVVQCAGQKVNKSGGKFVSLPSRYNKGPDRKIPTHRSPGLFKKD